MKLSNNITNPKGIKYELDKEVRTGDYWVDGKPIYIKIMQFNNPSNSQQLTTITDIETLIDFELIGKSEAECVKLPYAFNGKQATVNYGPQVKTFIYFGNFTFTDLFLKVLYTKTGG